MQKPAGSLLLKEAKHPETRRRRTYRSENQRVFRVFSKTKGIPLNYGVSSDSRRFLSKPTMIVPSMSMTGTPLCPDF